MYLVETKARDQLNTPDVLSKKTAALKYCSHVTRFTTAHGGKPWKYMLVPHDEVTIMASFEHLAIRYTEKY